MQAITGPVKTEYFTNDNLGSTVFVTDEIGAIVNQNDITPFGEKTGASGFKDMELRYTSKDIDSDTGLYYFNARWHDPQTGRFMSEDPIQDGELWYAYCNNNPTTLTDQNGLKPIGIQIKGLHHQLTVIVQSHLGQNLQRVAIQTHQIGVSQVRYFIAGMFILFSTYGIYSIRKGFKAFKTGLAKAGFIKVRQEFTGTPAKILGICSIISGIACFSVCLFIGISMLLSGRD